MKRILIIIPGLKHGGTNKSLQNLLSLIKDSKYSIDVFPMNNIGPYEKLLSNCRILPSNQYLSALMSSLSDNIDIKRKIFIIGLKCLNKLSTLIKKPLIEIILNKVASNLSNKKYDTVIAFQEGLATLFVSKIEASNRIAWIRSDYKSYLQLANKNPEVDIYKKFNSIICVSEYTKNSFCELIPILKNKAIAIHNIIDHSTIIKKSSDNIQDIRFNNKKFSIISIGRIDTVKRFSLIPEIIKSLNETGCDFMWYLIGGGGSKIEYDKLFSNVKKYSVSSYFTYLGAIDNPYPYIAKSDLLVCLSSTEACPNVINEAKILHTPIVSTDFGSSKEFLIEGENGCITPIENIADKISLIINNKKFYDSIKENLSSFMYDNDIIINKIYNIL